VFLLSSLFILGLCIGFYAWYFETLCYQKSERIESNVDFHVHGLVDNQFGDHEFEDYVTKEQIQIYNRIWDPVLYISATNNDELFIATNIIVEPKQTIGICPDHHSKHAICNSFNANDCRDKPASTRLL